MKKIIIVLMMILSLSVFVACTKEDTTIDTASVTIAGEVTRTLVVGDELALVSTVLPEDATDKAVVWTTSDASVASVSDSGAVVALSVGVAVIKATQGEFEASVTITVELEAVAVTDIAILGAPTDPVLANEEVQLAVTYNPTNATMKSVVWASSNTEIATVDQTGLVEALTSGTVTISATTTDGSNIEKSVDIIVQTEVLYGLTHELLTAIPAETDLQRWDVAWGSHPGEFVADLFDLNQSSDITDVIWRGVNPKNSDGVLADAGYGIILNALENEDDDTPSLAIYNKVDFSENAKELEIIARGTPNGANGGDPSLSGAGAFRVKVLVLVDGVYEVHVLTQTTTNYPQVDLGWVEFSEPPVVDSKDAFRFDIQAYAGMTDVIIVIEANDKVDTIGADDANLADRVIILATRVIAPVYVYDNFEASNLDAIPAETNLAKWDFAWGGQGASSTLVDFAKNAVADTPIWRILENNETSVIVDAGYGAVLNAFDTEDNELADVAMYNKADVAANATSLNVVARSAAVADTLSGAGAFRVVTFYFDGTQYVRNELTATFTEGQITAGVTQDENGWVLFDAPPAVDVDDLFMFDISPVAGQSNVVFIVEAMDRMDETSSTNTNLADRVIILAVRVITPPAYVYNQFLASDLDAIAKETNLAKWDFAWGGQGASSTLVDFAKNAVADTPIWRILENNESSVIVDAGYGAVLNALGETTGELANVAMYNKTDIAANAINLNVVARSAAVADSLSGAGAFRVVTYYFDGTQYVRSELVVTLTESQTTAGVTQDENGWVLFDTPPAVDADDLFTFDITPVAGQTNVVFVVEAMDRMDETSSTNTNLADRVIILAVRVIFS